MDAVETVLTWHPCLRSPEPEWLERLRAAGWSVLGLLVPAPGEPGAHRYRAVYGAAGGAVPRQRRSSDTRRMTTT